MTVAAVTPGVRFKVASEDWEFEAIHSLNYETFVEEIPQHQTRDDRRLVDRFHDQNTYFVAVRGRELLGMLALRGERPFSLDRKLPDLDRYLPDGRTVCEVRLLAARQGTRNGLVFRGLVDALTKYAMEHGFDTAVISGTVRQLKLYEHMGFVPFGPVVGSGDAVYQPMYLTLETFRKQDRTFPALRTAPQPAKVPVNFLPGPVPVWPRVSEAFARPAVSHRSLGFVRDFHETRRLLCELTRARHVQILMGSGTLANDVIAAQISTWRSPGLVLSNGAFGERLIDQAHRFSLDFRTHEVPWGRTFARHDLEAVLDQDPGIRWVWAVHGETSSGVLNDLEMLKQVARTRDVRLCVDAVSSLGNVPVDLSGVALVAGVSGKGFGAFPGLAMVFHATRPTAQASVPRYLDLGYYASQDGVPFTLSSNLLYALKAALEGFDQDRHAEHLAQAAARLREGLRGIGLSIAAEGSYFPAVTSVVLPLGINALQVGQRLEEAGYLVNYRSSHLPPRNWLQVCMMGAFDAEAIEPLLTAMGNLVSQSRGN